MSHLNDRRLWRRFGVLWFLSLMIPVGYSRMMGLLFIWKIYLAPVGVIFSGQVSDMLGLLARLILVCGIHSMIVFAVAELLYWISIGRDRTK